MGTSPALISSHGPGIGSESRLFERIQSHKAKNQRTAWLGPLDVLTLQHVGSLTEDMQVMTDADPSTSRFRADVPIRVTARLWQAAPPAEGQPEEEDVYGLVEVAVAPVPPPERAPIDVALVIDRSGSMAGEELDQAKGFVLFLAERLSPSDRLALLAFAEAPEVLVPLSPVSPSFAEAVEGLSAGRRSDLYRGWQEGIEVLADDSDPGRTRKLLVMTDGIPNVGETDPRQLGELARSAMEQHAIESSVIACTTSPRSLVDFANGLVDALAGWHFFYREGPAAILESEFEGLVSRVASEASLELTLGEGVRARDLLDEDWRQEGEAILGNLFAGSEHRRVFRLGTTRAQSDVREPLGQVTFSCVLDEDPPRRWEASLHLVLDLEQEERDSDPVGAEVLRAAASDIVGTVRSRWDRVLVRGTRKALMSAAERLRVIGTVATPWAEELERRVGELDRMEQRSRRVAEWCAGAQGQRLTIEGETRGVVGWVSVEALPPDRAEEDTEVGRLNLMVREARRAARTESAVTGRSCEVHGGAPGETVDSLFGGERYVAAGLDPEVDLVPSPPPPAVVRWWEGNHEVVSVKCQLHGELAQFDTSLSIGMLAPAWNVAVIEYHNRWERAWDDTYDTPEYDGCTVRIEPTSDPGGPNLLDVKEMWIVTEGAGRPWWPYGLLPADDAN